jgi:hypothetical protein
MSCQDSPYLSCSQPNRSLHGYVSSGMSTEPPEESCAQSASTSVAVLHFTWNEIDGLNLKSGPALMPMNVCPASSNETMSTEPDGGPSIWDTFNSAASKSRHVELGGFLCFLVEPEMRSDGLHSSTIS